MNRTRSMMTTAYRASPTIVILKLGHGSVKRTEKRLKR
ncbi:hypothetical protein LINPERPRIM_LOCUS25493 [Linum perenne]